MPKKLNLLKKIIVSSNACQRFTGVHTPDPPPDIPSTPPTIGLQVEQKQSSKVPVMGIAPPLRSYS